MKRVTLKEREKDIQSAILEDLQHRGAVEIKINNVGIRKANGDYIPPREKGISDIIACYKGRFIAIEVKSTGVKPTELQEIFLERIISAGGFACWVDSINQYQEFIHAVDLKLKGGEVRESNSFFIDINGSIHRKS